MTRTEVRYTNDSVRWKRFVNFNMAQLAELNKTWKPDLYWFDGDWEQTAEAWNSKGIVDLLRSDNKNVIINSRIQGYVIMLHRSREFLLYVLKINIGSCV